MSGTSLDGLDVVLVNFGRKAERYYYELLHAKTYPYDGYWQERLSKAPALSGQDLTYLDHDLAQLWAECVNRFLQQNKINPKTINCIASHGHTIFHRPDKGITLQIGNGTRLAVKTGLDVVNDFRVKDVVLGGQGAPLVPIGDELLMDDQFDACLNLGGISNLSYRSEEGRRMAMDISPCNILLNAVANQLGAKFDENGRWAREGELDVTLLAHFNKWPYYQKEGAKSLGAEDLEYFFEGFNMPADPHALLRTYAEHIAYQVANQLNELHLNQVMVSGGGALNTFLIERIQSFFHGKLVVADVQLLNFKEAIIFAFLGYLYLNNKMNVLSSATGSASDSCSGVLHRAAFTS